MDRYREEQERLNREALKRQQREALELSKAMEKEMQTHRTNATIGVDELRDLENELQVEL
jgi:hypothetical protein